MRRPRPLLTRISALVVLALAAAVAPAGCGDGDAPPTCGATSACASGQWCLYPDALCGKGASLGACTAISELNCAPAQVCGCDGKIYATVCAAAQAGVDTTDASSCAPPAGGFACGGSYCQAASQVCSTTTALTMGGSTVCQTSVACEPIPAACAATPTCACLSANGFPGSSTGDATSGLAVTAPRGC